MSPTTGSCRVLIIEDEALVLKYTTSVVKHLGFTTIFAATTLQAAEEVLKSYEIDLIISDRSLPDGDGQHFLIEILRTRTDLAAVLISGFASFEPGFPKDPTGRIWLLGKPFTVAEMKEIIDKSLGQKLMRA
jgi:response regulator of citrate/malate metabolism